MLTRWQGSFATVAVVAIACGLVAADLAYSGFRHWWVGHALTTDMVAGLLVLLITVLVADQLLGRHRIRGRSQATGAQVVIMLAQAGRSVSAVSASLDGTGARDAALDEFRTYMMMLLVGAPVLIEAPVSREFLEEAQRLAAEISLVLRAIGPSGGKPDRLPAALARLKAAADPILRILDFGELAAVSGLPDPAAAVPESPAGPS